MIRLISRGFEELLLTDEGGEATLGSILVGSTLRAVEEERDDRGPFYLLLPSGAFSIFPVHGCPSTWLVTVEEKLHPFFVDVILPWQIAFRRALRGAGLTDQVAIERVLDTDAETYEEAMVDLLLFKRGFEREGGLLSFPEWAEQIVGSRTEDWTFFLSGIGRILGMRLQTELAESNRERGGE